MHSQTNWDSQGGVSATNDSQHAERAARRFWVTFIVGLLGIQVAGGVFAVYLAVGDPTVAIIPNYYDSAVNWDVTRRARELTQDLGWRIEIGASPVAATNDNRPIDVRIVSRNGAPVSNISVSAKLFHHARGAEIYQVRFEETAPGVYQGTTSLTKAGVWQIELQMEGDHGIAAQSREMMVM